ncbi:MAG: gluconate 2-dehydrogenase subunit 3 family protein, partial [Pseudomonadota bacterium]|nr:gluconate 2-dehydrogenase subunit 3 family protein [Pseudomonadota bacterium]
MQIDRRTLLQSLAQGGLALGLMSGVAESVWSAVAAEGTPTPRVLKPAQNDMIALIADTILPRSNTPSATDVGVLPWIDLVVAEYFSDARRLKFLEELAAIDQFALSASGAPLAQLKDQA